MTPCNCSEGVAPQAPPTSDDEVSLIVDLDAYPLLERPRLLAELYDSPIGYYRFIGIPSAQATCVAFRAELPAMPIVNLHGDAHLEQYSTSSGGRGLSDFDDASAGPAVIDLVRFGGSLYLAARERGWEGEVEATMRHFLAGYREALIDPNLEVPMPACSARAAEERTKPKDEFFAFAEALMQPPSDEAVQEFERGFLRFRDMMTEVQPDLPAGYLDYKSFGSIDYGIGSALDKRFLIRVEGPTDDPLDDLILEAKEVRDLSSVECVAAGVGSGAFRVMVGQSRIGRLPQPILGFIPWSPGDGNPRKQVWIQTWMPDYVEISVHDIQNVSELRAVAYDIGVQLGLGHIAHIATPLDRQLRYAQRLMVEQFAERIIAESARLADDAERAWTIFRQQVDARRANQL